MDKLWFQLRFPDSKCQRLSHYPVPLPKAVANYWMSTMCWTPAKAWRIQRWIRQTHSMDSLSCVHSPGNLVPMCPQHLAQSLHRVRPQLVWNKWTAVGYTSTYITRLFVVHPRESGGQRMSCDLTFVPSRHLFGSSSLGLLAQPHWAIPKVPSSPGVPLSVSRWFRMIFPVASSFSPCSLVSLEP